MSFASDVKTEVSMINISKSEKIAELSGFIRSSFKNNFKSIEIFTENYNIAQRISNFITEVYNVKCNIVEDTVVLFNKKKVYILKISDEEEIILFDLSVIDKDYHYKQNVSDYIVGSLEEEKAYIRGAFFACGSINDPMTSQYHLEFLFDSKQEAVFVQRLLNDFDLNAKILLRGKKIMVYIKDSDDISDFLKIIGASSAVMYYENVRVLKEQKNITNRLNNCEQANIDKMVMSSNECVKNIELIFEKLGKEFLDDKLLEAALYRLKYPEVSLNELSEIIYVETNNRITKSGLNHRFRKIKEIASKLK